MKNKRVFGKVASGNSSLLAKTAAQPVFSAGSVRVGLLAFSLVALLFFASGFSSLIYQVVWTRMLVLVFGATTFATSTVLAIFMGGLALGSLIAGRFSDTVKRPLVWYGILEAVIGIWALLTPLLFVAATPIYKFIWLHTHASVLPFSLLRFACTGLILIVPTTCMGATLPLLSRYVTDQIDSIGSRVGTLYSANTLGAVVGALATGFFILPSLGIQASIWVAAAINFVLLAAVLCYNQIAQRNRHEQLLVVQPSTLMPVAAASAKLPLAVRIAVLSFACSGSVAMVYEVCWTRTLLMVIGSSTYAFTVMLGAFLIGIFIGSLICSRIINHLKNPFLWFGVLQLVIGLLTLVSMQQFNYLPFWNLYLNANLHLDANATMVLRFCLAGSVLIPTTLCLGAIFPLVVKGCVQDLSCVGRSIGDLYCANTIGAIIGAFLAGFVCLPLLGVERTLMAAGLVNVMLGLCLLWTCQNLTRPIRIIATACSVPLIIIFLQFPNVWDKNILLSVQSQRRVIASRGFHYTSFDEWKKSIDADSDIKFWSDGLCSNVGVKYRRKSKITSLITNGNVDASDDADMPVQALLSGFPLLLKPDAKDIAVIGWGSGQTVGTATLFPVHSVEAVELEPAVIKASKFFHHLNHSPELDKRVHIQYNDGRNFLLATDDKFDLVISEPSNPWQSGVCNLFTREYFDICRNRLKPGGILSAWVQTAEVSPADLCGVLAAIQGAFKYTLTFEPRPANLVILASDSPLTINMPAVVKALADSERLKEFKTVGVASPESLAAHIVVGSDGLKSMVSAYANSDDHNHLEFNVGKSYEDKLFISANRKVLAAMSGQPWKQLDWGDTSPAFKAASLAKIAEESRQYGGDRVALGWAQQSIATAENIDALKIAGRITAGHKFFREASALFHRAVLLKPNDPELLMLRGSVRVALNDRIGGRKDLEQAISGDPTSKISHYLLAGSYRPDVMGSVGTDRAAAAQKVLKLLGNLPQDETFVQRWPNTYALAAEAYFALGDNDRAQKYIEQYLTLKPGDKAATSMFKILSGG